MTPKTVLMRDWYTAKIELRTAVIAPKIEEMKFPRESTREGMIAAGLFLCLVVGLFMRFSLNSGQRCVQVGG